jgi:hypothetical protein
MGNFITADTDDVLSATAYALNENSNFPASRLVQWTKPFRSWKSTSLVSGTTYCALDVGALRTWTDHVLVIDRINLTAVTIKLSTSATFSGGTTGQTNVTVSQDPRDGRYKLWYDLTPIQQALGSTQTRYLGIFANTGTTTDGQSVMEVGSLIALNSTYTTWVSGGYSLNPGFPVEFTPVVPGVDNEVGSFIDPIRQGNSYVRIALHSNAQRSAFESTFMDIGRSFRHRFGVLYLNDGNSYEVYVVTLAADITWRRIAPNAGAYSGMLLRQAN